MNQKVSLLSPLNDLVFKALFGREEQQSKLLLIDFLNSVLDLQGPQAICTITHLNPMNYQEYQGDKQSILDIKVQTEQEERINIEVQVNHMDDFRKRSLYYWSRMYSETIHEAEAYTTLKRSIVINILNVDLIEETSRYHTKYQILETEEQFTLVDDLEIHYIELKKFNPGKDIESMEAIELWLTFMKNAGKENVDELLNKLGSRKEELRMAKEMLGKISADEMLRQKYYAQEKARLDEVSRIKYAEIKAAEKAMEKGKLEGKREVAKTMLSLGMPLEQIVRATELSPEEVLQLEEDSEK
ncbi:Rpn family recombination-promoting nuclease/putative transposase [Paenibacillus sp. S150]|uniref:Rpn family recombination-promoting nuclease/putative transposase n=1 Tax=Paenibacillus sp. S150 TaxID=2749826 RepID=UPI001C58C941|nr:Rpn family recombination-promoting nuclease/putative transposase [Paenibacillus sp. S150]MBW4081311.1 Rpn family recombination-promoting nuclease/putative transposase [Paenibacillus sp. S150]